MAAYHVYSVPIFIGWVRLGRSRRILSLFSPKVIGAPIRKTRAREGGRSGETGGFGGAEPPQKQNFGPPIRKLGPLEAPVSTRHPKALTEDRNTACVHMPACAEHEDLGSGLLGAWKLGSTDVVWSLPCAMRRASGSCGSTVTCQSTRQSHSCPAHKENTGALSKARPLLLQLPMSQATLRSASELYVHGP